MKTFNETMAGQYADYYNEHGEERALDFILKTKVSLSVLTNLYEDFTKQGVADMTNIPQEKKEKYWGIACKYFDELPERLKASKCVYALELITSTF